MRLGDRLARILDPIGGRWYKQWTTKRGKPCGCDKRQQKLNRWGDRVIAWWKRNA